MPDAGLKMLLPAGAGAGLLKDPVYMQKLVKAVVDSVSLPVTVKTRLGIDNNSIYILDVAKRMEDAGVKALTIHCRTRVMGHKGEAYWEWIRKVKEVVNIPVVLNGNVLSAHDVKRAFDETGADGVMIARGAIGNPWIFENAKQLLTQGYVSTLIDPAKRIKTTLRHLELAIKVKGERRAVLEHRKFYSGYLKGLYNASQVRNRLMAITEYNPVEDILLTYLEELEDYKVAV